MKEEDSPRRAFAAMDGISGVHNDTTLFVGVRKAYPCVSVLEEGGMSVVVGATKEGAGSVVCIPGAVPWGVGRERIEEEVTVSS